MDATKLKVAHSVKEPTIFLALAVAPTPQPTRLFAGGSDNTIHVYALDANPWKKLGNWSGHENYVSALVLTDDGQTLVSGSYDGQLMWWDVTSGQVRRRVTAHDGWVRQLAFGPGGEWLASIGDDMFLRFWDTKLGTPRRAVLAHERATPQGHVSAQYALAISHDGKHVATGDRVGSVRVWEADTGKMAREFAVPTLYTYDARQRKRSIGGVRSLAFSLDDKRIAVGGIGQIGNVDGLAGPAHVEIWDWQQPKIVGTFNAEGHKAMMNDVIFVPGTPWLLGAGGGGDNALIAVWDASKPGKPLHKVKVDGHFHRLRQTANGQAFYLAGHESLQYWTFGT